MLGVSKVQWARNFDDVKRLRCFLGLGSTEDNRWILQRVTYKHCSLQYLVDIIHLPRLRGNPERVLTN